MGNTFNLLKSKIFIFLLVSANFILFEPSHMLSPLCALAAGGQNPLLDLVFVIDNSGSMRKNDPNYITPKVVETFIRQLPEQSQVGMVLFDEKARLLQPMTSVAEERAGKALIDSLGKIDYRGLRTNTPAGIERAIYELKTDGRPLSQKGIVFITDGIVDTGDPLKDQELTTWLKQDLTAQCKQLGIRIFGIALTDAADFSLIQTLALRTDGEYFRTYEASEISGVLKEIQARMTPEPRPELAPLPLLPEPPEKPVAKQIQPDQVSQPPAATPLSGEKAVVVTEKSAWMITVTLALVIVSLKIGRAHV